MKTLPVGKLKTQFSEVLEKVKMGETFGISYGKKKIDLDTVEPEILLQLAEKMDFQVINLTPEEAITYHRVKEDSHNDPFDRILIWQSISRSMTSIRRDQEFNKFLPYGLKLIW